MHWNRTCSWITVYNTTYQVYCHMCSQSRHGSLLFLNEFLDNGFLNWKNAFKITDHEESNINKEAVTKFLVLSSVRCRSYDGILFRSTAKTCFLNCSQVLQGLALRGHNETLDSNLYNLLLLRAEDSKVWTMKRKY